jgi:hypothetical protein
MRVHGVINIVCALDCEAKPIIHHYGLTRNNKVGFKLYENSAIKLVVTGVGQSNCASTIDHLAQHNNSSSSWLNIGIAGHRDLAIGEGRLVHKINYENNKTCWYPPRLNKKRVDIDSMALITVDKPESSYHDNCLYDMEAAFFYPATIKKQTSELVQCYKIISDNQFSEIENINAKKVTASIDNKLNEISKIIDELLKLQKIPCITIKDYSIKALTDTYHFTQYQQHHLKKLLNRLSLLTNQENPVNVVPDLKNGGQVIEWLDNKISELPVKLQ